MGQTDQEHQRDQWLDDTMVAATVDQSSSTAKLIVSGAYSFGDKVAALLLGFATLYMLTRYTSQETFGVWVIYTATIATIEVARSGLIQNALIRFLTIADEREKGAIHGGAWLVNGSIGLLVSAGLYLLGGWAENRFNIPGFGELLAIYALTFLTTTPLWQFNYIQQVHLEFRGAFWATILRYSTLFALVAGMYFGIFAQEAVGVKILVILAWGQFLAATLAAIISYSYARKYFPRKLVFDWNWAKKIIHYGKYVFGTNLSSMLYKTVDTAMLAALLGGAAPAAIYGLAVRITNFVDVPTLTVASIVFPESSRMSAEAGKGEQARMYEQAVAAILAFVLPALCVVLVLPGPLVNLVGGSEYEETIPVLQLTVLYSIFVPFANQFGTLLDASGNPRENFLYTTAGMVLNVIMNFVFISRFGIIGAPFGTLLTYGVMFIIMQWVLHKRYGVRLTQVFKNLPSTYRRAWGFVQQRLPG